MMVLSNKCEKCNYVCNAIYFQHNFENWTSNDKYIDNLIQDTQLSAHSDAKVALEWIPYISFSNIKYIESIGVYSANWINGCIDNWNYESQNWKRNNKNMVVILKNLNNTNNF